MGEQLDVQLPSMPTTDESRHLMPGISFNVQSGDYGLVRSCSESVDCMAVLGAGVQHLQSLKALVKPDEKVV